MRPISFDVCLHCCKTRKVPAFSTTPVVPTCSCARSAVTRIDFEQAVADAYAAFHKECVNEDPRETLLRMQHFASSAAAALMEGNTKLFVSCLVSNAALARVLTTRAITPDGTDNADKHVAGADSRD